jgi:hypothetical protein
LVDRGEPASLQEPMRIIETSRHRKGLTDLAPKLATQSAGFRHGLPEGTLTDLAKLMRSMNCYNSNLIESMTPPGR